MWFLYILQCNDDSLYTGISTNVQRRIKEHSTGKGSRYVQSKLPAKLVYQERCKNRSSALKREARIKKLSRSGKLTVISSLSEKLTVISSRSEKSRSRFLSR